MRISVPLPLPVLANDDEAITAADILVWAKVERALSARRSSCRAPRQRHKAAR